MPPQRAPAPYRRTTCGDQQGRESALPARIHRRDRTNAVLYGRIVARVRRSARPGPRSGRTGHGQTRVAGRHSQRRRQGRGASETRSARQRGAQRTHHRCRSQRWRRRRPRGRARRPGGRRGGSWRSWWWERRERGQSAGMPRAGRDRSHKSTSAIRVPDPEGLSPASARRALHARLLWPFDILCVLITCSGERSAGSSRRTNALHFMALVEHWAQLVLHVLAIFLGSQLCSATNVKRPIRQQPHRGHAVSICAALAQCGRCMSGPRERAAPSSRPSAGWRFVECTLLCTHGGRGWKFSS